MVAEAGYRLVCLSALIVAVALAGQCDLAAADRTPRVGGNDGALQPEVESHSASNAGGGALLATDSSSRNSAASTCTFGGAMGVCQPVGSCAGTTYSGLCPGAANLKCCIGRGAAAAGVAAAAAAARGSSGTPRITQTTLQRLSEKEHRAKWTRFKAMHNKAYATPAVEAAAYAVFRANRVQIIYLNDRFGGGRAMFSSTSPLAATTPAAYAARLGGRATSSATTGTAAATVRKLLETGAQWSADEEREAAQEMQTPAHFQDEQWAAFSELASWAASNEDAIDHDESFLEVEAVQPCTTWGNEVGLCRPIQAGACRTGKDVSVVSSICPFGSRCCIGDRDDGFVPAAPAPTPQPQPQPGPLVVSPTNRPVSTARVSGLMIVDYRPFMQPITDQGECGSCWTFSAVGVVEGVAARSGLKVPAGGLSRQWLLECDGHPKHQKCRGGFPRYAMEWMQTHTPATAAGYAYTGMPALCKQNNGSGGIRVKETGLAVECVRTLVDRECNSSDQIGMLAALKKYGPLSVVLDASNWSFYAGGIYRGTACRNHWQAGNHAVIIVGYGEEAGKKFWLIQNSFGPRWGESGYIRLEAHNGHACGAANQVVYATVVKA